MSGAASSTRDPAAAARQLAKQFTARLTGRSERGPDHSDERGRRVPRRHSYDADTDPRAKPWTKIGDGSVRQGLAHRDALLATAEEFYHKQWRDFPAATVRDHEIEVAEARAELATIESGDVAVAPIGRRATLRQRIEQLDDWLARAAERIRRIDVMVLKALLKDIDFATGRLFPAIGTIAQVAGCHRNSVIGALRRLKQHGFVDWVRRTIVTGNDGQFAPQREQTSNAYFFDHRSRMARTTFLRLTQILTSKLRRLGAVPASVIAAAPPSTDVLAQRAAVASLGSSITSVSP